MDITEADRLIEKKPKLTFVNGKAKVVVVRIS